MNKWINFNTPNNQKVWADMCELMKAQPMTSPEMGRAIGIAESRASSFILHHRPLVHISFWKQTGCCWTAVYALGKGVDAVKPERVDPAKVKREQFLKRPRGFVPQPVARDWAVEMLFGPAVNLNAELREMRA